MEIEDLDKVLVFHDYFSRDGDGKTRTPDQHLAESFGAVETQTGVIVGDYTVIWTTFVMKIGTGPPEKLIRTTQRREFDDIDKARKYCELLMDNLSECFPIIKSSILEAKNCVSSINNSKLLLKTLFDIQKAANSDKNPLVLL